MNSSISPIEDCQLYKKRVIFIQEKGEKMKNIDVKSHDKVEEKKKYKMGCCGSRIH